MTSPGAGSDSTTRKTGKASRSFKRVYQACENCRDKKQKCVMGNPASPTPPCQTCRRANIACVLPRQKRKGRPPKKPRERGEYEYYAASAARDRGSSFRSTGDNEPGTTPQTAWQPFMTTFEPVVRAENKDGSRTSRSNSVTSQTPRPSYDQQMASRTLATFPLRNTSDAINILDQAEKGDNDQEHGHPAAGRSSNYNGPSPPQANFVLLEEGTISEQTLIDLFRFYLSSVHTVMPLIPYKRMPITSDDILAMARREPHFMSAILVVTAALKGNQELHVRLWQRAQRLFADVAILGANASVQVIEGLILLSEYPPNMGDGQGVGVEDRMCWMTVGTAVRLGYLLGLEEVMLPAEDVDEKLLQDRDRKKLIWSYCYCLDRQISIRLGKTFWHRSPGMTIHHQNRDPGDDFPEMRLIPGIQDDYAAYMHCLLHMTQIFSNAHDLLYPSKGRSVAVAKAEHYYKHIEDFSESLSAFRSRWQRRPWQTYPINECVWISFHHLRLYIYSFSLQAYLQRVSAHHASRPMDYFPAGFMASSDARLIVEAINAAADVLRLAIGRLQPSGALSLLPLRYFLIFSHAGVFLLKAAVIIPLPASQKRAILRLIRALIGCISTASTDPSHPGVRYSAALDRLLGRIYRARDLQTPNHTRPCSPSGATGNTAGPEWNQPSGNTQLPDEADLPALLGSTETQFVAERPLHDLAADMDALFGLASEDPFVGLQPTSGNVAQPAYWPSIDPFASLFTVDDREIWEPVAGSMMDWNTIGKGLGPN